MKVWYATALIKLVAAAVRYMSKMVRLVVLDGRSFTLESLYPGTRPGSNMALESGKL